MQVQLFEWSIQYNKWVHKFDVETSQEKIDAVILQYGIKADMLCYKFEIADIIIFTTNPLLFS